MRLKRDRFFYIFRSNKNSTNICRDKYFYNPRPTFLFSSIHCITHQSYLHCDVYSSHSILFWWLLFNAPTIKKKTIKMITFDVFSPPVSLECHVTIEILMGHSQWRCGEDTAELLCINSNPIKVPFKCHPSSYAFFPLYSITHFKSSLNFGARIRTQIK